MTSDELQEGIVTRYVEHERLRGMRTWTIYNRQRALTRLRKWAGGPILYLTEKDLLTWQRQRFDEVQPEPLRTEMSAHRQFYRWCVREGFRHDDPTARIDLPRVSRRVPRPIADAKLAAAMTNADPPMAAILALAAFAGLRACEIAQLNWAEVGLNDEAPVIRVLEGKGGHTGVVPASAALLAVLVELPNHRGSVIRRLDGKPGPNQAHRISARANDYLHGMGITDTLHQCRHRFATVTYRHCKDLRAVQELCRHASPTTTAGYTLASSEVARYAVESAGRLETAS